MIRLSAICSSTWAVQPIERLIAKQAGPVRGMTEP